MVLGGEMIIGKLFRFFVFFYSVIGRLIFFLFFFYYKEFVVYFKFYFFYEFLLMFC